MIRQPKKGMRIELHYAKKCGVRYVRHLQVGVIVIAPRTSRGNKNTLVRLDNGEMIIVPAGQLFEIKEKK